MVFTDPPYNVAITGKGKTTSTNTIQNDDMTAEDFTKFMEKTYRVYFASMKAGAAIYVCHADTERVNFTQEFERAGFYFSSVIIWVKNNATFGRQDYFWKHEPILYGWKPGAAHHWYGDARHHTVWDHEPTDEEMIAEMKRIIKKDNEGNSSIWKVDRPSRSQEHPTMKPIQLVSIAVRNSSKRDDMVLDLFGGSGSTLIACHGLNRTCYTMELDPKYVDVIIKRWEKLTGEKALKQ